MRVIAGTVRGRRLEAPAGLNTRPLTDRIRESLFNILNPRLEGCRFLDLFAGSGSAGIEALSRGAESAVFIEINAEARRCLSKNLQHCGFQNHGELLRGDVFKSLPSLLQQDQIFDIIYVDPPFSQPELFSRFMKAIDQNSDILALDGCLIIRSQRQMNMPETTATLQRYRRSEYGESILNFYNKKQEVTKHE